MKRLLPTLLIVAFTLVPVAFAHIDAPDEASIPEDALASAQQHEQASEQNDQSVFH